MSDTPPPPPPPPSAPVPPPWSAPPEHRLLRRSRQDRVIGGVCGGLGRYLGVDPVLLRIAAVVLAIAGGSGVALYIVGWIVIPEERDTDPAGATFQSRDRGNSAGVVFGALLIAVGGVLLVQQVLPWAGRVVWPLVLVGVGAMILFQGWRR